MGASEEEWRNAVPLEVVGEGGATRSKGTSYLRYDLIPTCANRRRAQRWGLGAETHGPYNWLDGKMPGSVMLYHMEEHLNRFKARRERFRQMVLDGCDEREWHDMRLSHDDDLAAVAWAADALMYLDENDPLLLVK